MDAQIIQLYASVIQAIAALAFLGTVAYDPYTHFVWLAAIPGALGRAAIGKNWKLRRSQHDCLKITLALARGAGSSQAAHQWAGQRMWEPLTRRRNLGVKLRKVKGNGNEFWLSGPRTRRTAVPLNKMLASG